MAKKVNYKQPILQWLAKGNNARMKPENALEAFRVDVPELKKCPDQTIWDYQKRYVAGMRASETKAETVAKPKPVKKVKVKKEAAAKKLSGPRLFLQSGCVIQSPLSI